jgi:class 3 adenylate cyclase
MSEAARARLTLRLPDHAPQEFEVGAEPLTIGRDVTCDVRVESRYVSRKHVRLEQVADDYVLTELGSANPTFVNGERIQGNRVLSAGDIIQVADVSLEFSREVEFDPEATAVLPVGIIDEAPVNVPETERFRIQEMFAHRGTLTIMFTDLEGSTAITARLGDVQAQEFLRKHNGLLRAEFDEYGGLEVKGQGDGFMVAFTSARHALRCAVAIQRRLAAYNAELPEVPIQVRIGINLGEVISEEEDFFGTAVIIAARIAARATGGEILVSEVVQQVAEPSGEFRLSARGSARLKGLPRHHRLFAVEWNESAS